MLFNTPIDEITWSEIEGFCNEQIPEGTFLDYKKDFPNNLQKSISAMANTYGGVILIGIKEINNFPSIPINGIDYKRGLSEKVMNIILSSMTPPVIPEIKVCPNTNKDKAIIVIRIPQSDASPHAISNNKQIYIRTGDLNNPEEIISIDQLEWLQNKREKSLVLKEDLFSQAKVRSEEVLGMNVRKHPELYLILGNINHILEIIISPVYPKDWLIDPSKLALIFDSIKIEDRFGTSREFPPIDINLTGKKLNIIQDGIYTVCKFNERFFYSEFNSSGLFYFKQNLEVDKNNPDDPNNFYIRGAELFSRIISCLSIAS